MGPRKARKREFPIARNGGLKPAEQFLGLRDIENLDTSLDVVFVSIDLEVSRYEKGKPGAPAVKQFGVATLDTRRLKDSASLPGTTKTISTQQFSTSCASADFLDCDVTDFNECVFAETYRVSQEDLPATITGCLFIQDSNIPDSSPRNIVLVGHSLRADLQILQRLGIDVTKVAPVLGMLDTDPIARDLLGPSSTSLNGAPPMTSFTLGALLTKLQCPFERSNLHNAGNDATFTLHALLMLAIRSSESRDLAFDERENFENLRALMQLELYECPRWKPERRALGFYASESPSLWNPDVWNNQSDE